MTSAVMHGSSEAAEALHLEIRSLAFFNCETQFLAKIELKTTCSHMDIIPAFHYVLMSVSVECNLNPALSLTFSPSLPASHFITLLTGVKENHIIIFIDNYQ